MCPGQKKQTLTHLIISYKSIIINNKTVNIRLILTLAQRIIFFNVSSVVSDFENIFKKNNVKLCFKISILKAGMT